MKQIKTIALIGLGAMGCALAPGLQKAVGVKIFRVIRVFVQYPVKYGDYTCHSGYVVRGNT